MIISISPYTFLVSLFIKILGGKPIVYLRSDGYGEYKAILGRIGPIIYHFMFSITGAISNLISCRSHILRGKKGKIISPSQLDSVWLRQPKNLDIKNFKFHAMRLGIEPVLCFFLLIVVGFSRMSYDVHRFSIRCAKLLENPEDQGFTFFAFLPPYFGVSGSLVYLNR